MIRLGAALAALAALSGPVGAACPEPAALAGGLALEMNDRRITYVAEAAGLIGSRTETADGTIRTEHRLAHGLIAVESRADFQDPAIPDQWTRTDADPAAIAANLPFGPDTRFALDAPITDLVTGASEAQTIVVAGGPVGPVRIGDCLLEGQRLVLRYERAAGSYSTEVTWLPDYGFAFTTRLITGTMPDMTFDPHTLSAE